MHQSMTCTLLDLCVPFHSHKNTGKPAVDVSKPYGPTDLTLGQVQVHAIKSSTCRENPQKNQLYLYILSAFECKRFHSDFGDSKKTVPSTCAARSYCKISVLIFRTCVSKNQAAKAFTSSLLSNSWHKQTCVSYRKTCVGYYPLCIGNPGIMRKVNQCFGTIK